MLIRHCDRCKKETGNRDYYVWNAVRHDKANGAGIKTVTDVELCETCHDDVRREIANRPAEYAGAR